MPRIARIVATEYPHHITQRGNYRQPVFTNDSEYNNYLIWLDEYAKRYKLEIFAYCLMPNHVHFIAIPNESDSLARTFNAAHMRYSQYFNKKSRLTGHLWQGRFYSCVLDNNHLYATVRYIENNPVRANLVEKPWSWNWSSAKAHLNKEKSIISLVDISKYMKIDDWAAYLLEKEDDADITKIRTNTLSGKPLGDDSFIMNLEKRIGKRLRTFPRGRPKKKQEK